MRGLLFYPKKQSKARLSDGSEIYDFRTTDMIPDTLLHNKLGIPCKKGLYQNGKKDLFAVVIALRYLISDTEFKTFRRNLAILIKDVLKNALISQKTSY